jgi:hypothetical protein
MKEKRIKLKAVPMYDLFSKGNYVGSYRMKTEAEDEILRDLDAFQKQIGHLENRQLESQFRGEHLRDRRFTVIRSTHYELA